MLAGSTLAGGRCAVISYRVTVISWRQRRAGGVEARGSCCDGSGGDDFRDVHGGLLMGLLTANEREREIMEKEKKLAGERDQAVRDLLRTYNTWSRRGWDDREKTTKALEALRAFIKPESRKFKSRVQSIMAASRSEWTLDKAELSIVIHHDHQPLEYYVSAQVVLNFYDDWRRGELRLSASIDKVDLLLAEVATCVCGKKVGEE